ncbi:26102_t:CDS:2, partial [Gigaspora rosea]
TLSPNRDQNRKKLGLDPIDPNQCALFDFGLSPNKFKTRIRIGGQNWHSAGQG